MPVGNHPPVLYRKILGIVPGCKEKPQTPAKVYLVRTIRWCLEKAVFFKTGVQNAIPFRYAHSVDAERHFRQITVVFNVLLDVEQNCYKIVDVWQRLRDAKRKSVHVCALINRFDLSFANKTYIFRNDGSLLFIVQRLDPGGPVGGVLL